MVNKTSKINTKRLSKGQRTHNRRLKQAARKEINPNSPHSSLVVPVRLRNKKQDQS